MKITLKSHDLIVTVESPYESGSIQDYFEAFRGCLIAVTFQPETIDQYILEWADEIRENALGLIANQAQELKMGYYEDS